MKRSTRDLLGALSTIDVVADLPLPHKRGAPFSFPAHSMLKAFFVMTVKKIKSFQALHNFLANNAPVCEACGFGGKLPHRRTLERRFAAFSP